MTASGQAKQRRGCSRFILFVLALLLTFTVPLSLLLFNVGRVIFNAGLVKRVTADVLVHSDIIPAGLEWYGEWRARERYDEDLARPWEGEPDIVQLMTFLDAAPRFRDWNPDLRIARQLGVHIEYSSMRNEVRCPELRLSSSDRVRTSGMTPRMTSRGVSFGPATSIRGTYAGGSVSSGTVAPGASPGNAQSGRTSSGSSGREAQGSGTSAGGKIKG